MVTMSIDSHSKLVYTVITTGEQNPTIKEDNQMSTIEIVSKSEALKEWEALAAEAAAEACLYVRRRL